MSRSTLRIEDQQFFFDTIKKLSTIDNLPNLTLDQFLKALTINYAPLREICLKRLENLALSLNGISTLGKNAVVRILGGTTMKKTAIKNKLKELSIGYSPKISPKVTHVLIGKNPKNFEDITKESLKIITENQLQKFFSENQPQYLEQAAQSEGNQVVQENLTALLTSPDATNAIIDLTQSKNIRPAVYA